jgi:hypothetical protein
MGKQIATLIDRGHSNHIGPYFPTFITHRSKTTPDIILSNRHAFHNHFSEPGPVTPSDHIPIIFKISTNPIQIKIKPRLNRRGEAVQRIIPAGVNRLVVPTSVIG